MITMSLSILQKVMVKIMARFEGINSDSYITVIITCKR